jgi:hypothetical protein
MGTIQVKGEHVAIELSYGEIERAVEAYLYAHGVRVVGPYAIQWFGGVPTGMTIRAYSRVLVRGETWEPGA